MNNSVPTNGQINCTGPNGNTLVAHYNIAVVLAENYYANFATQEIAREQARLHLEDGIDVLQHALDVNGYKLEINLFFISSFHLITPTYLGQEAFLSKAKIEFANHFPCVNQDGLVVITPSGAHGYGVNNGALIGGYLSPSLMAHELGHLIGLVHCCAPSGDPNQDNCECPLSGDGSIMAPSCTEPDFTTDCEIKTLNTEIMTSGNCLKYMDIVDDLPSDYVCPLNPVPTVSIICDQHYLLEASKGCTPDRSLATYTVTVHAGMNPLNGATLKLFYQPTAYPVDIANLVLDANYDEAIDGTFHALSFRENNMTKPFNLAAYSDITFHFQLRYNPASPPILGMTTGFTTVKAKLYYGTNQEVTNEVFPLPLATVNAGTYTQDNLGNYHQPLLLAGNVSLFPSAPGNKVVLNAPLVLMASGSYLNVAGSKTLEIGNEVSTTIEGCNSMWVGITMASGSKMNMDKATIMDAQKAIQVGSGGKLVVTNSRFYDNNYGIFTVYNTFNNYNITLTGNDFGTVNGFKPFYNNQTPLPGTGLGNIGFVGIYADPVVSG